MAEFADFSLVSCGVGLVLAAALHDAATRTIPNWIPACLTAVGLVLRFRSGEGLLGFGIAVIMLLLLGLLWLRGYMGGGDVKLIPAVSLIMPPSSVPHYVLSVALAGGVLALIYLVLSRVMSRPASGPRNGLLARIVKAETWRMHRRGPLPYAVAIAAGALPGIFKTFSG